MNRIFNSLWRGLKFAWRVWLKIAHTIGKINTVILLTIFYFLILGIAKLITLCGRKDLLDERWKDRSSYWGKREKLVAIPEAFLKPY